MLTHCSWKSLSGIKAWERISCRKCAVAAVILVFAAELTLRAFDKEGLSDRFITCWYTFWGSELAFLAGIKITKVRTSPFAPSDDEADDDAAG